MSSPSPSDLMFSNQGSGPNHLGALTVVPPFREEEVALAGVTQPDASFHSHPLHVVGSSHGWACEEVHSRKYSGRDSDYLCISEHSTRLYHGGTHNTCEQEKLRGIAEAKVVVFDNSNSQGEDCTCQGTAWEILEILVLACILTFLLHCGLKAGWRLRQLCARWQGVRDERIRQQILKQQRFEQEMKEHRTEALQCARDQAEQEL